MYTSGQDIERSLLLQLWSGPANAGADLERAVAEMQRAAEGSSARGEKLVIVVEVEPGNPRPNSEERRRISRAVNAAPKAPRCFLALVTASREIRSVVTALSWFIRDPHVVRSAHATFEEAAAWVDERRPGVAARLRELRRDAWGEAARRRARS